MAGKYPDILHDDVVGVPMWYEIDWRPDTIIWRIGKSEGSMQVLGYMDGRTTRVPENQMVAVVSQEWHYAHWWPTNPFPQGNIPYPEKAIKGVLYEIIIE